MSKNKYTQEDIDNLFRLWHTDKEKIKELDSNIKRYKRLANKMLNYFQKEKLNNDDFILKRTKVNRETISKKQVPKDIWDKFCTKNQYYMLNLKEIL